jgi:hypothetical protein
MNPRSERVFDGLRYTPGARFRIVRNGAVLRGMTLVGRGRFRGWSQPLHVGDVLHCTGFGPGWGSDPGYGVEFTSERSVADGAVHCDVSPHVGGAWSYRPDPSFVEAVESDG